MTNTLETAIRTSDLAGVSQRYGAGITLVEVVMATGFLLLVAALAVPGLRGHLESRRIADATLEIEQIDTAVLAYQEQHARLPASLSDLDIEIPDDPWGAPYRYAALVVSTNTKPRTDSRQVPINTDFDLYSVGPDGDSAATVTALQSRDDIIRAHDGRYIGPASQH